MRTLTLTLTMVLMLSLGCASTRTQLGPFKLSGAVDPVGDSFLKFEFNTCEALREIPWVGDQVGALCGPEPEADVVGTPH